MNYVHIAKVVAGRHHGIYERQRCNEHSAPEYFLWRVEIAGLIADIVTRILIVLAILRAVMGKPKSQAEAEPKAAKSTTAPRLRLPSTFFLCRKEPADMNED